MWIAALVGVAIGNLRVVDAIGGADWTDEQADALMTLYVVRMLERGFLVGGAFYPTLAHNDNNVAEFLNAAMEVFAELSDSLRAGDASQRVGGNVKHSGFRRLN